MALKSQRGLAQPEVFVLEKSGHCSSRVCDAEPWLNACRAALPLGACWAVISEIIYVNHIQSLESHLKNKRRSFSPRHLFSTSAKISHSAIWRRGSCAPLNESDCLFSFNQHGASEKMENFPSSLCMFFQGLIVVSCGERLVIYVPTHFILIKNTSSFVQMVWGTLRWDLSHTLLRRSK